MPVRNCPVAPPTQFQVLPLWSTCTGMFVPGTRGPEHMLRTPSLPESRSFGGVTPLGPDWESEDVAFILPPSADGVQDSQEWPELAPNTLLSGPGPDWRAVPRPRRQQTAFRGPRICHVAGGCADLPRAKCPVPHRRPRSFMPLALAAASWRSARWPEPRLPGQELPGQVLREGRELAPGNSPPDQEASEARLLGLRTGDREPGRGPMERRASHSGLLGLLSGFRAKILSHQSPQALLSWPGLPPPHPCLCALTPDGDPTGEQA